jgi:hypothetical protein
LRQGFCKASSQAMNHAKYYCTHKKALRGITNRLQTLGLL